MVKVLSVCIYVKAKDLHKKITGTAVFFPESFNNNLETHRDIHSVIKLKV